ncbi:Bug family tripartite tricarboxylate transporter substrate binding protein [Cupriavidus metallidurans]|uniref:Bug family tripartite tricarboxylate transporter substrate binding protein n=1 Tax=Cupriavidus metallidurans TaxID=119219 RepID=UPI001CCED071|nr:tripartite tricarboxylate transporter substrate binding protein [Cupriavidus metallidurans]UBM08475.1 tripartite tricarboxylate transporter substrate binding protein [Cupriavidus metallidurans]
METMNILGKKTCSSAAAIMIAGLFALCGQANAQADNFPNRPIKVVVPYPAGASTDLLARIVGQTMSKVLGQSVVVENRPGAGGIIAAEYTARSAPDGYTIMMTSAGILTNNPSMYKKLPYDAVKDFAPISIAAQLPLVIVVNNKLPAKSFQELMNLAKKEPGKLSYGSAGTGTSQHLAGELLKSMAKVDILHVPYKGGSPAMADLLAGQISMMFVQTASALPQVRNGKVRAIAIGSPQRSAMMPDVPTIAESGVPGYNSDTWYGYVAPAGVPQPILARLHAAIVAGLKENKEKLLNDGYVVDGGTPQQMAAAIKTDTSKWGEIIRSAHITADQ